MKVAKILIILFLFISCSREPHFDQVKPDLIQSDFHKNDEIDTLIKTKNYIFLGVADYPDRGLLWDASYYYFLQKNKKLYLLKPNKDIRNGFIELKPINDSIIVFYTQLFERIFGDFWLVKKDESFRLYYDPGTFSNTTEYDLIYSNGKLIRIGDINVNIDSIRLKALRNNLYQLKSDSLIKINTYDKINLGSQFSPKDNFQNLNNGIYYFSYPGRKIDYLINLNKIK